MQLTTLISATLVACSGLSAAAPNAIPTTDVAWPTSTPVLEEGHENLSTSADQSNADDNDGALNGTTVAKRGDWVRKVRMCEHANGRGSCVYKDFRPNSGCYNLWYGFNDQMSSIYLAPGTHCTVFAEAGCRGKWLRVFDPGYNNLKVQSSYMNDRASSLTCAAR